MRTTLCSISFLQTILLVFRISQCNVVALERQSNYVPEVRITNGTILGIHNPERQQDAFLGVPFAQPPIGELRFSHPQSLRDTLEKPYKAFKYGSFCHGNSLNLIGFSQPNIRYPESEDCLTLNIVRPSLVSDQNKLPVLVWIHGGGFQEGGSGDERYNMSHLVKTSVDMGKPIIAVSINYRLGPFGFIAGKPFREQNLTNLGLHDQRLALGWIQDNIGEFGGDHRRVTIQGESAGALSVGVHLLSNEGRDESLYHQAIVQSGGPFFHLPFASNAAQDLMLERLAIAARCSNNSIITCLKSVPAEKLASLTANTSWNPVIDEGLILGLPSDALSKGRFNNVPLLLGANTNEGTPFVPFFSTIGAKSAQEVNNALIAYKGGNISMELQERFQELYLNRDKEAEERDLGTVLRDPGEPYGPLYGSISLLAGDLTMIGGRRITAESWAKFGGTAYSYRFDTVPAGVSPSILGSAHFQEIPFVFRNEKGDGHETKPFLIADPDLKQRYLHLSELMSRMWISFTSTGSPNNHGMEDARIHWPKYDIADPRNLVFNAVRGPSLEVDNFRSEAIRLIGNTASQFNR